MEIATNKTRGFSEDTWAQIYRTFGEHYRRNKNIKAAVLNLQKALRLKENDFAAVHTLAKIYCDNGESEKALEIFSKLKVYRKLSFT